ncbi:DUF551 domain-containing protein [Cronobacter turicensis]|uniref:DUF551 domain-containing protein n=1 Tax=Cronobacter turicensis TaxID=413502 RepID=UPI001411B732|nr:DUF551 domain-containing protein [Cronobacter turicensis]NHV08281.1 DUF551 domain-containing protein [Cronobacter turicensis]NHV62833.1 DUF551 domain-containing protein [Cronobacter turicensis]NHW09774.1 DUF551 domain-containing protein [Cronobacter turicensis]
MEWIKCSERMPPDGEYVLVATDDTVWVETHFIEFDHTSGQMMWFSANAEAELRPAHHFTHWMELPTPPAE